MTDLLDNISQDSLIVVCIALCAIAVLVAILLLYQMISSRRKVEVIKEETDVDDKEEVVLNIKHDDNITYESLDDEMQRQKAKEELKELKEKLRNEELNKAKEKSENAIIQNSAPLVTKISNEEKNSIIENREVIPLEEDVQPEEEKTKEIVGLPEEIAKIENKAKEEKEQITKEIEVKIEEPIKEEVKEEIEETKEVVVEKPKEEKKDFKDIDQATKERIIDEYLKQAIVNRIEEEKKKQEIIIKKIEEEKKVLNFNDDDLEIIDTYLTHDDEEEEQVKEEAPSIETVKEESEIIPDETYIDDSITVTDSAYSLIKDVYDEKLEDTGTINTKEINDELAKLEEQILDAPTSREIEEKEEVKEESFADKASLYEQLEEENAIISYDELLKATKFGYTDEEMNNYVDEEDAIISLDEFENLYKEVNKLAKEDSKVDFSKLDMNKKEEEKKFKNSEIISPVYGTHKEEELKPVISDEDIIKLNDEIKKTNDFLNTLKELKKNLD